MSTATASTIWWSGPPQRTTARSSMPDRSPSCSEARAGPCREAPWSSTRAADGVAERSETADRFGASLAAGDLDGDGYDDVVAGIPGEGLNGRDDVGAVVVVPGSATGPVPGRAGCSTRTAPTSPAATSPVTSGAQRSQSATSTVTATTMWPSVRPARASARPRAHGCGDRAVGVRRRISGARRRCIRARPESPGSTSPAIGGGPPSRSVTSTVTASTTWPSARRARRWAVGPPSDRSRSSPVPRAACVAMPQSCGIREPSGVPGVNEPGDGWGSSLASGDLTGDGIAELVVGAPNESIGRIAGVGAVTILAGSPTGLTAAGAALWHQNRPGVPGVNESGDSWGAATAVTDLDDDGVGDLVVGAPGESIGGRGGDRRGHGVAGLAHGRGDRRFPPPPPGIARRTRRQRARRRVGGTCRVADACDATCPSMLDRPVTRDTSCTAGSTRQG